MARPFLVLFIFQELVFAVSYAEIIVVFGEEVEQSPLFLYMHIVNIINGGRQGQSYKDEPRDFARHT